MCGLTASSPWVIFSEERKEEKDCSSSDSVIGDLAHVTDAYSDVLARQPGLRKLSGSFKKVHPGGMSGNHQELRIFGYANDPQQGLIFC